jgi:hypothetical protein
MAQGYRSPPRRGRKKPVPNKLHGLIDVERRTLVNFRRAAHLQHVDIEPQPFPPERIPAAWPCSLVRNLDTSLIEWLALIRHHGGPARLVDVTKSFWVAVFFALQPKANPCPRGRPAIWAVSRKKLWDHAMEKLCGKGNATAYKWAKLDREQYRRRLGNLACRKGIALDDDWMPIKPRGPSQPELEQPLVLPVEPERMNERLRAQHGLFLFPMDSSKSFEENLASTLGEERESGEYTKGKTYLPLPRVSGTSWVDCAGVAKMSLPLVPPSVKSSSKDGDQQWRRKIRQGMELLEGMGITAASLFPDLNGAAEALAINVLR